MKKTRFIFILISIVLILSIFAGCDKKADETPTEKPTQAVTQDKTETATEEKQEEMASGKLFEETFAFSAVMINHPHLSDRMFEENGLLYEIQDILNVDIDWTLETQSGYGEKLSTILASGELPDLINIDSDTTLNTWKDEGAAIALDNLLSEYGGNIMNAYSPSDLAFIKDVVDGNIYTVRTLSEVRAAFTTAIRSDWLSDLGLEIPTTFDELEDCLIAFKENDMFGSGATIPWSGPLDALYWAYGISRIDTPTQDVSTDTLYVIYDNKYVPYMEHPNYKALLTKLAEMYANDLIDKEYLSRNKDTAKMQEIWSSGQTGAACWWAATFQTATNLARENDPDAYYEPIVPVVGPMGDQIIGGRGSVGDRNCITIAAQENGKAEGVMKFLDWGFSDAGKLYWNFGIEGIHFDMVNGEPKLKSDYTVGWTEKRGIGLDFLPFARYQSMASFTQTMLAGKTPEELTVVENITNYAFTIVDPYIFPAARSINTESSLEIGAEIYPVLQTLEAQAIAGEISIDEFFEKYAQLKADGLDTITADINAAYDNLK